MYVLELGGEDDRFAAREAATAATDVAPFAPGLATAAAVDPDRVRGLAFTRRASELVGRTGASVDAARALLAGATVDRRGTVAVRARDVRNTAGVDTRTAERELGAVLTGRGFAVDLDDPDHELRALFAGGRCALGWLAVESVRDYGTRKPTDRPFFQPGSMHPLLARAVANLAGAGPGRTLVDPMCGTGGILIEAGLVGSRVVGVDAQSKMVEGTRENLAHFLSPRSDYDVLLGDATRLPLCGGGDRGPVDADPVPVDPEAGDRRDGIDGVLFDAPYGRQSKVATHDLRDLVAGALAEASRVAPRAVLVADRPWTDVVRGAGWMVEDAFERRVHRSLTRHVLILGP